MGYEGVICVVVHSGDRYCFPIANGWEWRTRSDGFGLLSVQNQYGDRPSESVAEFPRDIVRVVMVEVPQAAEDTK